jgi:hypothetical protein
VLYVFWFLLAATLGRWTDFDSFALLPLYANIDSSSWTEANSKPSIFLELLSFSDYSGMD